MSLKFNLVETSEDIFCSVSTLAWEYRAENVFGSLIATRLTKIMLVASPQFFRLHLYFLSNYDAFFL